MEGGGGGGFTLPPDMSEDDVVRTVRDLLGADVDEDMTDDMIRDAVRSGIISELCPELALYVKTASEKNDVEKAEEADSEIEDSTKEIHQNLQPDQDEDWEYRQSDSDFSTAMKYKKKKKKHQRERERKDRERSKVKEEKKERPKPVVIISDSSEEDERPRKEEKERHKKKKKKRVMYFSISSDSDGDDQGKNPKQEVKIKMEGTSKEKAQDEMDTKPKIPQGGGGVGGSSLPSTAAASKDVRPKEEKKGELKKKLPKPFSKYNSSMSVSSLRKWKPFLDRDHLKYQQRGFSLKPVSIVCVDLLDHPLIFHHPEQEPKNRLSEPLTSQVTLTDSRLDMIRRLERDKTKWFKGMINKKAIKFMKHYTNQTSSSKRSCLNSSDDDGRKRKSDIDDSGKVRIPSKKIKQVDLVDLDDDTNQKRGQSDRGNVSKTAREAELKKRKLEEIKKKSNEISAFKEKERAERAETKKIMEKIREERLAKQNKATSQSPASAFQRLWAQIIAAEKKEAAKPKVELKIPKISENTPQPPTELKVMPKLSVGLGDAIYKEVARLLSSDVKVTCPVIPEVVDDLGEYTVNKIAWWLLKNEKDPAVTKEWHPELHDDEEFEAIREDDDYDWLDDTSSINGCVSDPEDRDKDRPPDLSKINDPDWIDEYCGEATLCAKIRRLKKVDDLESEENFKSFLRTTVGTYEKTNFEVKCFICKSIITGQRELGAHIRSAAHKDNFRNYCLTRAGYEEKFEPVVPKKEFVAKLVEYTVNATSFASNAEEQPEVTHQVRKIERARSESPGPIIAGYAGANVITCQEPIPDDVSFGSMENYDISSDDSLMQVKAKLRTLEKWNWDLERRWRQWIDEENVIAQKYNAQREFYIENPAKHECYDREWQTFWDRRCNELELEGIDTENYDFNREWMPFWLKRVQEIMKEKVEEEVLQLKRSLRIDKHSLRAWFNISAAETKRREKKNRNDNDEDWENLSDVRSAYEHPPPDSTTHKPKYSGNANRFGNQAAHRSNFHPKYGFGFSQDKRFDNGNQYRQGKRKKKNRKFKSGPRPQPYHHQNNNRGRNRRGFQSGIPNTSRPSPHGNNQNWTEGRSDQWRTSGQNESSRNADRESDWEVDNPNPSNVTQRVIYPTEDMSDTESINSKELSKKLGKLKEELAKEEGCSNWEDIPW